MTELEAELLEFATEEIDENGRDVIFRKIVNTIDKSTGVVATTTTDVPAKALFASYQKNDIAPEPILAGDKKAVVAAKASLAGIDPSWALLDPDAASQWRIVGVSEVSPGETVIVYEIQARR